MPVVPPILINNGTERRAEPRYKVNFRVRLGLGSQVSPEYEGAITDLSRGGCFVECDERVFPDDQVKLSIDVPGHSVLTVWGYVTFRVAAAGFGVRFTAFSQGRDRDQLALILIDEARRS
jgi:hypothetical protein